MVWTKISYFFPIMSIWQHEDDGLDTISAEARADVHTGCVTTTSCAEPEHHRHVIGQMG